MKQFQSKKEKNEIINTLKVMGKKKNLNVLTKQDKVEIFLQREKFSADEGAIPVRFCGKFLKEQESTVLKGKFTYGFYLYTLVFVAILLIAVRFGLSVWQKQTDNIVLCGIVAVVLLLVMVYVRHKAKSAKKYISDFLMQVFRM